MKYFTQKQLAERWQVSQSTLKNWREKGELPFFQVPHSARVLYPVDQIIELEKSNTKEVKRKKPISRNWRI